MATFNKIETYKWIYKYFHSNGIPENSEIQLSDLLNRLRTDISKMERDNLHTKAYTISDNLRQEILRTMRELKAFDEESAVSAKEIREHNEFLASQRQVMGITNLMKSAVENGEIIKIPRPNPKTHVKYYLNKSE